MSHDYLIHGDLKITHKLKELTQGMKYNNFTIGTHGLRSNPEPVHGCKYLHPSAM